MSKSPIEELSEFGPLPLNHLSAISVTVFNRSNLSLLLIKDTTSLYLYRVFLATLSAMHILNNAASNPFNLMC